MNDKMRQALRELRALCNEEIGRANASAFRRYPGGPVHNPDVPFVRMNAMLKACDKVFAAENE